jgi:hypothetical protein
METRMQTVLPWLAMGVGAATLALALLRSGVSRRPPSTAWPFIFVAGAVLGLAALLTLPAQPPFSPGQTLGAGIMLGGIAVLLGMCAGASSGVSGQSAGSYDSWSGRLGAPVCGVSLLLILYSNRVLDALSGFALGALIVGLVVGGGLALAAQGDSDGDPLNRELARGAELTALIATVLAAAVYLATFHRGPTGVREWQSLPALFAAAAAALLAVRAAAGAPAGRSWLYDLLLIPIPLLVIGWLVAHQLNGTSSFLVVVGLGLGVFGLIAWLDRVAAGRVAAGSGLARLDLALLTSLLAFGGAVLAFREASGYGLALMTLAGLALYPLAVASDEGAAPTRGLFANAVLIGALLALYRMFTERNDYARGFQPDFLYYYVALALGALLPALLAGAADDSMPAADTPPGGRTFSALARVLLVGAVSLALPLAVWLLIGDRPQAALLVGLTVGVALLASRDTLGGAGQAPLWRLSAALIALSAVQFTHLLLPLALRTRGQRLGVLTAVAAVVLLALALTAWRESRLRAQTTA